MAETSQVLWGRIAFPALFEPKTIKGTNGDPRYSMLLVIPKDTKKGKESWNKAEEGIETAKEAGAKKCKKWEGEIPDDLELKIIKDGDSRKVQKKNPEFAGCWIISMSSKQRPQVVDRNLKEIIKPDTIYPGCQVRVDCNFFGYDTGSNGIGCGLNSVQFWDDDEPFSARRSAEDAFGDSSDEEDDTPPKKRSLKDLF